MPKNKVKGIRYVNWHLYIMVCGAPLGTMVRDIQDYLQRILNNKISNEEFDKRVYESPNFNKYYFSGYKKEIGVLMSGLLRKRKSPKERVPKCSLVNLNVNRRKTKNRKDDYEHIIKYIEKQSTLTQVIESKEPLKELLESYSKIFVEAKKKDYKSIISVSLGTGVHGYKHNDIAKNIVVRLNELVKEYDINFTLVLPNKEIVNEYDEHVK